MQALATLPQVPIPMERNPAPAYISFVNGGVGAAMKKLLAVALA